MRTKFIHRLFLSCCHATLLMEKKLSGTISPKERFLLWAHLKICQICKLYQRQLSCLDQQLNSRIEVMQGNPFNAAERKIFKAQIVKKIKN